MTSQDLQNAINYLKNEFDYTVKNIEWFETRLEASECMCGPLGNGIDEYARNPEGLYDMARYFMHEELNPSEPSERRDAEWA